MGLLALTCSRCAADLGAVVDRRIHYCDSCGGTLAAEGMRLREMPRQLVRPRRRPKADAEILLLPVWGLSVRTEAMTEVGVRMPTEIRIPAVGVSRMPLLLQFARNLTRAPADWSPWEEVVVGRESAEVDAEAAFAFAEVVALRHVEGWPADDDIESVEIPLGSARLLDWPCMRQGSEIVELVCGLSVSRAIADEAGLRDRRPDLQRALADVFGTETPVA